MACGVLLLASHIPVAQQPNKTFQRLLRRLFRSSEYLISTMGWDLTMTPTHLDYWIRAFLTREIAALPQKLGAWGKAVNTSVLSDTTPEQLQMLSDKAQIILLRIINLINGINLSPVSGDKISHFSRGYLFLGLG